MDDDYPLSDDKKRFLIKIIPRNLTAFAAYPVPGNPAISRPESGVEVSYPGLEIDQRALEQRFFPGLYFEFQREDGVILADVKLKPNQLASGLSTSDLSPTRPLFLLGMYYKVKATDEKPQFFSFQGLRGQDVGPRIRDLLPGRVAIIFGPSWDVAIADTFSGLRLDTRLNQIEAAYNAVKNEDKFKVFRDNNGKLVCGIFSDDRTTYLNGYGVIDTDVFPPGDLTKSLCAPWIFDFRDCLCFYWASNKPDITDGTEPPFLNYLRDRNINPPPPPSANYHTWVGQRIGAGFLMSGDWRKLPIVINDREERSGTYTDREDQPDDVPLRLFSRLDPPFNRDDIVNELKYLATVEHALIVEYLFAHYSLKAPRSLKEENLTDEAKLLFGAAEDLLEIAIDEMRHFLWVNQLLRLLKCDKPVTERADFIGLSPEKDTNFNRKPLPTFKYLNRPVSLRSISFPVLDEFIEIEANSRNLGKGTSFGMYVHILASILHGDSGLPSTDHAVRLVKLLIDEGDQHGVIFQSIRKRLERVKGGFARTLSQGGDYDQSVLKLLDLADTHYYSLLKFIHLSYSLKERAGGDLIRDAVYQMRLMHEVGHVLAATHNVGLRFTKPERDQFEVPENNEKALEVLDNNEKQLILQLEAVEETGDDQSKRLAQRQKKTSQRLYRKLRKTIRENK